MKPVSLHYERPESVEEAERAGPPTREETVDMLSDHLCRCTGYEPIVGAIAQDAEAR